MAAGSTPAVAQPRAAEPAPAAAAPSAAPVRLDRRHAEALAALGAGDAVEVLWGGTYWPARVTARVGADRYQIHYEGYGPEWDETVGPDRVRLR